MSVRQQSQRFPSSKDSLAFAIFILLEFWDYWNEFKFTFLYYFQWFFWGSLLFHAIVPPVCPIGRKMYRNLSLLVLPSLSTAIQCPLLICNCLPFPKVPLWFSFFAYDLYFLILLFLVDFTYLHQCFLKNSKLILSLSLHY